MSKAVSGWFGRSSSRSSSKDLNPSAKDQQQQQAEDCPADTTTTDANSATTPTTTTTTLTTVDSDDDSQTDHDDSSYADFDERELGPLVSLKEQIEKDKEDESLRRWKAQLLGAVSLDTGDIEPEVKILSLGVMSKGRPDSNLPLPLTTNSRGYTFSLKEGCTVCLKYVFTVRNNLVPGLTCVNTVWKSGFQVDETHDMMGTFAPQHEPYVHVAEEEVTPSGALARGAYTARKRFIDDDGRVHLDLDYSFEIRKDW